MEAMKEWAPVIGVIAFAIATFISGLQERRQAREISHDAASKEAVHALAARITAQDSTISDLRIRLTRAEDDLRRCREDREDVERALREVEAEARQLRQRREQ